MSGEHRGLQASAASSALMLPPLFGSQVQPRSDRGSSSVPPARRARVRATERRVKSSERKGASDLSLRRPSSERIGRPPRPRRSSTESSVEAMQLDSSSGASAAMLSSEAQERASSCAPKLTANVLPPICASSSTSTKQCPPDGEQRKLDTASVLDDHERPRSASCSPTLRTGQQASASDGSAANAATIQTQFSEEFSWGRSFGKYVGTGYIPESLLKRLEGLELIHQLFVIRHEMKLRIRYESGRATIRRPSKGRGQNKPVTYASNIWNRGYANCAGHCIVFAAVLQMLGVPYCIVSVRSEKAGVVKHAIMEVGFCESCDTRAVNNRAHELWEEYYGKKMVIRKDKETGEAKWVKIFRGLKFSHSRAGSEAAKKKGVGHWLWVDPLVNIGYYLHLVDQGYIVQEGKGFSFALTPEIKTWREVASDDSGAITSSPGATDKNADENLDGCHSEATVHDADGKCCISNLE